MKRLVSLFLRFSVSIFCSSYIRLSLLRGLFYLLLYCRKDIFYVVFNFDRVLYVRFNDCFHSLFSKIQYKEKIL